MPYLTEEGKAWIDAEPVRVKKPGELNYLITKLLLDETSYAVLWDGVEIAVDLYVANNGASYETYNSVMGVLLCASLEYTRRTNHNVPGGVLKEYAQYFYQTVLVPYEDKKIKENGDVYE